MSEVGASTTEPIVTCDICDKPQGCPDGRPDCVLAEWNGDTGCHVACEEGETA